MKKLFAHWLLAVCCAATSGLASAQAAWPTRPVKIIVPFTAGGSADATARAIAERLSQAFNQSFVVENKPGGAATIGGSFVAKSEPDGYTLLLMPGANVLASKLQISLSYDPMKDLTPISNLVFAPYVLVASKQSGFNSLRDAVQHAKAHPGEVSIGNSEITTRLTAESVARAAGVELTHVPYKGGSLITGDVLGGHLALGVVTGPSVGGAYKEQRLTVLAVSAAKRMDIFPEVPTVAEALGIPEFEYQTWYALVGPPKLPSAIADRLSQAIGTLLSDKQMRARLQDLGLVPADDTSADGLRTLMKNFSQKNGALIDAANIKGE